MSQHDRDLATEIYAELTSEPSVAGALDVWRHAFTEQPNERRRMRLLLGIVTAEAIDRVLACRQREAARTGPWGDYEEET